MSDQQINNNSSPQYYDDDISLKEVLLKAKEYWQEIRQNLKIIYALVFICSLGFFINAYLVPKQYSGRITFMVNEYGKNSGGGISSVLSQFGLSGGGSEEYNYKKILKLSKSRKIIQEVLLKRTIVDGEMDIVANHIIKNSDLHSDWASTKLEGFLFIKNEMEKFGRRENLVLKKVHQELIKEEGLFTSNYGMETGIMNFGVSSRNEDLSFFLVNEIYKALSLFYTEKTIEKQLSTYNLIVGKRDSLRRVLDSKQLGVLIFMDKNRNLSLNQYNAKKYEMERDVQMLIQAYGEASKNAELAAFSLETATPFFQVIDEPLFPLQTKRASKIQAIITGGILGMVLGIIFIIGRFLIRTALAEE